MPQRPRRTVPKRRVPARRGAAKAKKQSPRAPTRPQRAPSEGAAASPKSSAVLAVRDKFIELNEQYFEQSIRHKLSDLASNKQAAWEPTLTRMRAASPSCVVESASGVDIEATAAAIKKFCEEKMAEVLAAGLTHDKPGVFYSAFDAGTKGTGMATARAQLTGGTVEMTPGGKLLDEGLPWPQLNEIVSSVGAKYLWDFISIHFAAENALRFDEVTVVVDPNTPRELFEGKTWNRYERHVIEAGELRQKIMIVDRDSGLAYEAGVGAVDVERLEALSKSLEEERARLKKHREERGLDNTQLISKMYRDRGDGTLEGLSTAQIVVARKAFKHAVRTRSKPEMIELFRAVASERAYVQSYGRMEGGEWLNPSSVPELIDAWYEPKRPYPLVMPKEIYDPDDG